MPKPYTPQFAVLRTPFIGRIEELVAVVSDPREVHNIRIRCLTAHRYEWTCEPIIWGSGPGAI